MPDQTPEFSAIEIDAGENGSARGFDVYLWDGTQIVGGMERVTEEMIVALIQSLSHKMKSDEELDDVICCVKAVTRKVKELAGLVKPWCSIRIKLR